MAYWVIVASADHAARGKRDGFVMANHGKKAPMGKMSVGDRVLVYSPKEEFGKDTPLKAFTGLATIVGAQPEPSTVMTEVSAFQRAAKFEDVQRVALADVRDFVPLSKLRFGFFRLDDEAGQAIEAKMLATDSR